MMDLIPYFAGLVTLLFGVGFYFGLQEFKNLEDN
ncbi:MAG: hypothetical protein ACJAX1_002634 [Neolewinella sp.]|jgi:hypothetical protein